MYVCLYPVSGTRLHYPSTYSYTHLSASLSFSNINILVSKSTNIFLNQLVSSLCHKRTKFSSRAPSWYSAQIKPCTSDLCRSEIMVFSVGYCWLGEQLPNYSPFHDNVPNSIVIFVDDEGVIWIFIKIMNNSWLCLQWCRYTTTGVKKISRAIMWGFFLCSNITHVCLSLKVSPSPHKITYLVYIKLVTTRKLSGQRECIVSLRWNQKAVYFLLEAINIVLHVNGQHNNSYIRW